MKQIFFTIFFLSAAIHPFAQNKGTGTNREAIKQFMNNQDTLQSLKRDSDAVKWV